MSILFHFTLILLKLEHALITTKLNQNPKKKVMLLYKKVVLIRCCKWLSFQSAKYDDDKNHLAQEAMFDFLFH